MRKLLRFTVLAGLMVLFGAAEDGVVFGIGSAQARIGRPLTPMSYAGVARRTTRRAYRRGYYYGGYHALRVSRSELRCLVRGEGNQRMRGIL